MRYLWYHLKQRFWRKHHVIHTGLPKWEWSDTRYRMLYGIMNLLTEFVEKEVPDSYIDWDAIEHTKEAKKEFMAVYEWWKNYEKRLEEIEQALDAWHDERFKGCPDNKWMERIKEPRSSEAEKLMQELNGMEEALELETTDMLCRLVKVRGHLWT